MIHVILEDLEKNIVFFFEFKIIKGTESSFFFLEFYMFSMRNNVYNVSPLSTDMVQNAANGDIKIPVLFISLFDPVILNISFISGAECLDVESNDQFLIHCNSFETDTASEGENIDQGKLKSYFVADYMFLGFVCSLKKEFFYKTPLKAGFF